MHTIKPHTILIYLTFATKMFSTKIIVRSFSSSPRMASQLGDLGGGSGKGGGSGGAVRDAGGALGKMEAAREEEYFNKLKQQQLKLLKLQLKREQDHHEEQAKHHRDVMERNKKRIHELEEESNST
uniref:ATPase inhibitor, mitochondrial n=1 Tax=Globodera rostochiensis TaxID=31243 RepID=A0A914GZZ2_GLORO